MCAFKAPVATGTSSKAAPLQHQRSCSYSCSCRQADQRDRDGRGWGAMPTSMCGAMAAAFLAGRMQVQMPLLNLKRSLSLRCCLLLLPGRARGSSPGSSAASGCRCTHYHNCTRQAGLHVCTCTSHGEDSEFPTQVLPGCC